MQTADPSQVLVSNLTASLIIKLIWVEVNNNNNKCSSNNNTKRGVLMQILFELTSFTGCKVSFSDIRLIRVVK